MRLKGGVKPAAFELRYAPSTEDQLVVGYLDFRDGVWTFRYDETFKKRGIRPIEGFDDVEKVYRSPALFPFFAVRIPDVDRTDVRRKLQEQRVRDPQQTDLLRIFGRRVLSSPAFELIPRAA